MSKTIIKTTLAPDPIGIVGGTHDITTGEVHFYDDALIIK